MDTEKQHTAGTASGIASGEVDAVRDDANSTLRQEALELLAPLISPNENPHPFTPAELVCLVVLALNEREVSQIRIFQYICTNIKQYTERVVEMFAFGQTADFQSVLPGFNSVF